jgi:hypothetical protein
MDMVGRAATVDLKESRGQSHGQKAKDKKDKNQTQANREEK